MEQLQAKKHQTYYHLILYIKDQITLKEIEVKYCPTYDMITIFLRNRFKVRHYLRSGA
jgi:hypothetical protein